MRQCLFTARADGEKRLDADRYEFLAYRLLHHALESGDVSVQDSTEFRRFKDDLISDARWLEKDAVLLEVASPVLLAPIKDTLAQAQAVIFLGEAGHAAILGLEAVKIFPPHVFCANLDWYW